jgi:hypothetical protein
MGEQLILILVAGPGLEPIPPGYEPGELPITPSRDKSNLTFEIKLTFVNNKFWLRLKNFH